VSLSFFRSAMDAISLSSPHPTPPHPTRINLSFPPHHTHLEQKKSGLELGCCLLLKWHSARQILRHACFMGTNSLTASAREAHIVGTLTL
jgi:hypothetical protein